MWSMLVGVFALAAAEPERDTARMWAPAVAAQKASATSSLLDEISPSLGVSARAAIESSLPGFVNAVHPMYSSTPKNQFDRLGHAAVRYVVNRLFVQRHGWFVNGLYAGQGSTQMNETSVTDALLQYVPPRAQHAFELRLSGEGLDETETALLAATVETVIFEDAVSELRHTYRLAGYAMEGNDLTTKQLEQVLEMHMGLRLSGFNQANVEFDLDNLDQLVLEMYPRWPLTKKFMQDLRQELEPGREKFDFDSTARIVREFEGRWARWSALDECQDLKGKLLAIEEGSNTGCVRLSDFYKRSLDPVDGWQFKENPAYLRQLGALDDSEPSNPRVIVANYINMPGNCVPSSKFYMACCISECESLQVHIESVLQAPDGTPEDIVAIVEKLPSQSAPDHTVITPKLRMRLWEIAERHGGRVPLHGRLFAQWMHFAYPRECTFPHVAGTTNPIAPDFFSLNQMVDDKTVHKFIDAGKNQTLVTDSGTCMHWRHEEEIFVPTLHPAMTSLADLEQDASVWTCMYMVGGLSSVSLMLARTMQSAWARKDSKLSKELAIMV